MVAYVATLRSTQIQVWDLYVQARCTSGQLPSLHWKFSSPCTCAHKHGSLCHTPCTHMILNARPHTACTSFDTCVSMCECTNVHVDFMCRGMSGRRVHHCGVHLVLTPQACSLLKWWATGGARCTIQMTSPMPPCLAQRHPHSSHTALTLPGVPQGGILVLKGWRKGRGLLLQAMQPGPLGGALKWM